MNRHNDGTPLTNADLLAIATDAGLDVEGIRSVCITMHSENMTRSTLLDATRGVRLDLFLAGQLRLVTEDPSLRVRKPIPTVDCETAAFFLSITAP